MRLVALLCVLAVCSCLAKSQTPQPPVLQDPAYANGTLTFNSRNVTNRCALYYNFAEKGRLRFDTFPPGGVIQSYIGDWKSMESFFATMHAPHDVCYKFCNSHPVPDPNFFRKATFMGRTKIGAFLTQHWRTQVRGNEKANEMLFFASGDSASSADDHHNIDLFVLDSDPKVPVRIAFFNMRIDIDTYKAGFSGDPSIWDLPKACTASKLNNRC